MRCLCDAMGETQLLIKIFFLHKIQGPAFEVLKKLNGYHAMLDERKQKRRGEENPEKNPNI